MVQKNENKEEKIGYLMKIMTTVVEDDRKGKGSQILEIQKHVSECILNFGADVLQLQKTI